METISTRAYSIKIMPLLAIWPNRRSERMLKAVNKKPKLINIKKQITTVRGLALTKAPIRGNATRPSAIGVSRLVRLAKNSFLKGLCGTIYKYGFIISLLQGPAALRKNST